MPTKLTSDCFHNRPARSPRAAHNLVFVFRVNPQGFYTSLLHCCSLKDQSPEVGKTLRIRTLFFVFGTRVFGERVVIIPQPPSPSNQLLFFLKIFIFLSVLSLESTHFGGGKWNVLFCFSSVPGRQPAPEFGSKGEPFQPCTIFGRRATFFKVRERGSFRFGFLSHPL